MPDSHGAASVVKTETLWLAKQAMKVQHLKMKRAGVNCLTRRLEPPANPAERYFH
jgi:hypothetical protein